MITEIETYFSQGCGRCARFATPDCATAIWRDGLARLRALARGAGLDETLRWGHPCYRHAGRNVAIIGAVRTDFRLSFFEAGLMQDPAGVLERQGPNTLDPDMIRFTSAADVGALAPTVTAYLAEAMGYAAAGARAPKSTAPLDLPPVLAAALAEDAELGAGFGRLTPGRQKSYVIALSSAKTAQTQARRIAKFRDKILAGKGATER